MKASAIIVFVCLVFLDPSAGKAEPAIRYATLTSINKAPPGLVAQQKGLFKKYGVDVEMKLFPSGKTAIEAMAAGQFDIGMFGDIPGLALLERGYPGKIIAAGLGGPKRQALVVPLHSKYRRLKDLQGKRIGLTKNSTDEIALQATMQKDGLQWSGFNVINLQPAEKATVLKTGGVDAIEAWEPVPSIIVVNQIGRRLLTADGDVPDIVGVVIASDQILKRNPNGVIQFLKALHEGAVYAQTHPDEMVEFLATQLRIKREVLLESVPTQWWYIEFFDDTLGDWQRSADFMYQIKRVSAPFKVRRLVDFSYLSKALGKTYPLQVHASQAIKYPVLTLTR